jgi:hypothetical protein
MNRDSGFAGAVARAMLAGALGLSLVITASALAQDATSKDDATVTRAIESASPAEPPRRARDRRRSAAVPDETQAPEATAVATTDTETTALAIEPDESSETKIVCKNIKVLGTKISRRTCGTPEQWAAQARKTTDDAQETMRQVRDRSAIAMPEPASTVGAGGN